jgi:hypothetical protein
MDAKDAKGAKFRNGDGWLAAGIPSVAKANPTLRG